jgi:hypothetical protein
MSCLHVERDSASKEAYRNRNLASSIRASTLRNRRDEFCVSLATDEETGLTGETRAKKGPGNLASGWK